jgi:transcriptional regulator with PAS, ATPase and Fis domain
VGFWELENIIERSFSLCREGHIGIVHLPAELTSSGLATSQTADIRSARNVLSAQVISAALERNNYNRQAAANELGIYKTTLFRRIKKLGLILPEQDGRMKVGGE